MRFRVSSPLTAICAGQFGLSLLHVVFMFYYVKVFLNVFHVSQWWFNLAQLLFMIWNAINDPLFGYLQDSHHGWMRSRTKIIRFFGPFICISFVFLWFPWDVTGSWIEGIHLITGLFLYDAFFSAIGVAWSALFADSTKDSRLRVAAMKYSQIAILLSVNGIAVMEKASHSLENMTAFRIVSIIMALLGFVCLQLAGSLEGTLHLRHSITDDTEALMGEGDDSGDNIDTEKSVETETSWNHALQLTSEMLRQKDFIVIIITNFIHIMRSVSHMNFASITTEALIPQEILPKGSLRISVFYAFLTLGPQILIILCEKLVVRIGASRLLLRSYMFSVLSAILLCIFSSSPFAVMFFMFIDAINVHSASPLFNIIISDFIDEDAKRHSRGSPLSSFVFSLNALFTKPAQSVAPVIVVYILNIYGYQEYLATKLVTGDLHKAMQAVLYLTPFILGIIQYFVFKRYSLIRKPQKEIVV